MKLRVLSAFFLTTAAALPASAHVRFTYPTPRYESPAGADNGENIKDAPCGTAGDSRTTDPTRVTVFQPGQTITVEFTETINHGGHFRIAFDDDGQDAFMTPLAQTDVQAVPTLPVLVDDIADGPAGNYTQEITLPNVECENCTLQLIQVMSDAETWTVEDIYFTCADIAIRGASGGSGGTGGSGGASGGSAGSGGSGGAATGGSGGTATGGSAGSTASAGTTSAGGSGGSGGMTTQPPRVTNPNETGEEGSCSLNGSPSRPGIAGLALIGLVGAALRLRRRRR